MICGPLAGIGERNGENCSCIEAKLILHQSRVEFLCISILAEAACSEGHKPSLPSAQAQESLDGMNNLFILGSSQRTFWRLQSL